MDSLHDARRIERVAALSEAADGTAPLDEATLMAPGLGLTPLVDLLQSARSSDEQSDSQPKQ